ncbi:MAG: hypothetical protein IJJ80_10840 [Clostridia bacterium]|nr:hypothetical protein [Clostridia bacterium]MBQ6233987.1 hypothetical protein [Clostridia bacterium]
MYDPFAEEERKTKRERLRFWRNLSRVGDFYAWLIGAVVVFALLALLFSLFTFVRQSATVFLNTLLGGIQ